MREFKLSSMTGGSIWIDNSYINYQVVHGCGLMGNIYHWYHHGVLEPFEFSCRF